MLRLQLIVDSDNWHVNTLIVQTIVRIPERRGW
jgi:hypothetical protein